MFILLDDNISYFSHHNCQLQQYCDVLANDSTNEHSICYSLVNSSIVNDPAFIKRIVKKSECQDIRVIRNFTTNARNSWKNKSQYYSSAKEYKTLSLDMLLKGLNSFLNLVNTALQERLELSPTEKPEDIKAYESKIAEYRMKRHKDGISYRSLWQ